MLLRRTRHGAAAVLVHIENVIAGTPRTPYSTRLLSHFDQPGAGVLSCWRAMLWICIVTRTRRLRNSGMFGTMRRCLPTKLFLILQHRANLSCLRRRRESENCIFDGMIQLIAVYCDFSSVRHAMMTGSAADGKRSMGSLHPCVAVDNYRRLGEEQFVYRPFCSHVGVGKTQPHPATPWWVAFTPLPLSSRAF